MSPGWPLTAALTYSHCTTAPNGCTALGDTAICWTMHNLGVSRNTSDHLIHNLLNTFASCHTFLLGRRKGWVCIKYLVIANPPPLLLCILLPLPVQVTRSPLTADFLCSVPGQIARYAAAECCWRRRMMYRTSL